ncbi:uncharacterized protein LOC113238970 [Hyposmocoma kahamanoa]|uniref:uncharacterized protein LOC113238970 n=1 Tax=Hyposmocoma kahamanoa TaxID=1477025 RepID=UPI000E6D8E55|nr:uncharacterized protein LOC113238970 [Hyposmocoma kahamanoa]
MTRAGIAIVLTLTVSTIIAIRVPTVNNGESDVQSGGIDTSDSTVASRQAGYGLIKFEDQQSPSQNQFGLITFESQPTRPLKFEESNFSNQGVANLNFPSVSQNLPNNVLNYPPDNLNDLDNNPTGVVFQDNNNLEAQNQRPVAQKQKKKRRRRRRPRLQHFPGQGYPGLGPLPGEFPQGGNPYTNPGYPGQFQGPYRRPNQSPASQALTAVTEALTSIALYDDYQCVPRLLCEAASGGALATAGASPVLQSIANIQPLLTLLAAYNGASISPLFVFGRAVFLGMTSKSNPGTCRYAYSQCPNDPEQLVHYLNNHNGGFFRFFSNPQYPNAQLGQQNLEQFYNQLAGPGQYGLQSNFPNQPSPHNQYGLQQNINAQNYGIYSPYPVDQFNGQPQHSAFPGQITGQQQNYGLFPNVPYQNLGVQPSNLYNGYKQNYGYEYSYQNKNGLNQYRTNYNDTEENRAQKRIQNIKFSSQETTIENLDYDDRNTKWLFPDATKSTKFYSNGEGNIRGGRQLQFPERDATNENVSRIAKGFYFPGDQSNRQYYDFYKPMFSLFNNNPDNDGHKLTNVSHNIDHNEDEFEIIYIVRGDGDPNNPEIQKVRHGGKVL